MYQSMTVPSQSLQLASAELLAPVFASNPEPPEPSSWMWALAGLPTSHCDLPARLLPTSKGFLSSLAGCLETPEAQTQITKLAEQAACFFPLKENVNEP